MIYVQTTLIYYRYALNYSIYTMVNLDASIQLEVLVYGEELQQRVKLRAVADALADLDLVTEDVELVDQRRP